MRRAGVLRLILPIAVAVAVAMVPVGEAAAGGARGTTSAARTGKAKVRSAAAERARVARAPRAQVQARRAANAQRLHARVASKFNARDQVTQHLSAMAAKLRTVGIGAGRADSVAHHVALGMPTEVGRTDPNNYLLARNEYVVGYSRDLVAPKWAAWRLTARDIQTNYVRQDRFRTDKTLPDGWPRAGKADYKNSGQTRGHLVSSGERSANSRANSKTFVLTNVLPQSEKNNAGPWNHFEHYYRDLAQKGHDVYLMAGGVYSPNPERIGQNGVAVPYATWKVAVILEKGQTIADIGPKTRVVSILVPNNNTTVQLHQSFAQYRVTPRDIERMTGNTFFTALPPDLRQVLVDRLDSSNIPAPVFDRPWQQRKAAKERSRGGQTTPVAAPAQP